MADDGEDDTPEDAEGPILEETEALLDTDGADNADDSDGAGDILEPELLDTADEAEIRSDIDEGTGRLDFPETDTPDGAEARSESDEGTERMDFSDGTGAPEEATSLGDSKVDAGETNIVDDLTGFPDLPSSFTEDAVDCPIGGGRMPVFDFGGVFVSPLGPILVLDAIPPLLVPVAPDS